MTASIGWTFKKCGDTLGTNSTCPTRVQENQVKESDDAKQAIQIVRASSSEERSAAFHQSMSQVRR